MTDNFIKLEESDVLRLPIKTKDGEDTGEYLEFDLEDIELPLKFQDMLEKDKKNREYLKNTITILDKRKDVKGKKLLSRNQEDKIKAIKDFIEKEKDIYNLFLGENGVEKLLNGKKLGWTSLQQVDKIIQEQILPHIDLKMTNIQEKIKEKYNVNNNKDEILK